LNKSRIQKDQFTAEVMIILRHLAFCIRYSAVQKSVKIFIPKFQEDAELQKQIFIIANAFALLDDYIVGKNAEKRTSVQQMKSYEKSGSTHHNYRDLRAGCNGRSGTSCFPVLP
jgi:hypothetical protein